MEILIVPEDKIVPILLAWTSRRETLVPQDLIWNSSMGTLVPQTKIVPTLELSANPV